MPLVNYHSVLTLKSMLSSELLSLGFSLKEALTLLRHVVANQKMIRSCYRMVPSAIWEIWEIFSEFLISCSLFKIIAKYEKLGKYLPILNEETCENYFIVKHLFK